MLKYKKMFTSMIAILLNITLLVSPSNAKVSNILDANTTAAVMSIITNFILLDIDTTPPTITLKGANQINLKQGEIFQDPGISTSDNRNGKITVAVSGSVDTSKVGEYILTYIATDTSGNSNSVTRLVTVTSNTIDLNSTQKYNQKLNFGQQGQFVLKNAPQGMAIFPNGTLTWTPTNNQGGNFTVTIDLENNGSIVSSKKLDFNVTNVKATYDGVFVNLTGIKGSGSGTPNDPYGTFKDACSNLNGKHNIYIRGGVYKNPGYHSDYSKNGRYPSIDIQCQGTQNKPLVIRPWGNEYVKLKTDALSAIRIKKGVQYITVENFEIEGEAQSITLDEALKYWWWDTNDTMQSSGIVTNGGDHLTIRNNIVHDMPGSGISVVAGAYATIENNIVYNSDWWTIAGSKGIGITQAVDDPAAPANGAFKNKIVGNLIFNIEQRLFSHVWGKGFATLSIDEGEAFLVQEGKQVSGSTSTSYTGKYLLKDNLFIYNGKSGVINLAKDVNVTNNSYYNNGTATKQSAFRVSTSTNVNFSNNAIEANIPNTIIYSIANNSLSSVFFENNYAKGVVQRNGVPILGIISKNKVFNDPQNLDFNVSIGIPAGIGTSQNALNAIKQKQKFYNIVVQKEHLDVNMSAMTKYIVENAPGDINCTHYNDIKNPYVLITNIDSNHSIVKNGGFNQWKLFINHPYGNCINRP